MRLLLCTLGLLSVAPAGAHRLDEYLQATTIAVGKRSIEAEMRLVPGVAVFHTVFVAIDSDANGAASAAERDAYARRVLEDVTFTVDGAPLPLRVVNVTFDDKAALQDGRGEIQIRLMADLPRAAAKHRLVFENRHQRAIASYLVNALVPGEPDVRIAAQQRSYDQSSFQLDFTDASAPAGLSSFAAGSGAWGWSDLALAALTFALVAAAWRVTVRVRRSGRSGGQALRARPVGDQP
jgi:hypothetical protein